MTSANTFNMALTDNNANIRYSNNSGSSAFTIPIGGSGRQMRAIDMSSSGAHIVVGESNVDGRAYLSTDSAVSFTLLTNSPIGPYKRILISNSGSVIIANIENATHPVYYSIDAGESELYNKECIFILKRVFFHVYMYFSTNSLLFLFFSPSPLCRFYMVTYCWYKYNCKLDL